jgi:8-hydroxy-5-deazaflavin:NADPH oxidoreductase
MKIAIIGSGNVGKALAGSATRAGHEVTLTANDPSHAEEAAKMTNASAARSSKEAVKDAELVILAVPANKVDDVVISLANDLDGKVIVDVTNRVDMADPGKTLDGTSVAERVQGKATKARVVKAFNYAFASRMADPMVDGTNLDAFIAGDDDGAKQKVEEFARSIGFRPIDAGPLSMARALEGMAILNILLQIKHKWPWQSGWKLAGPTGDQK